MIAVIAAALFIWHRAGEGERKSDGSNAGVTGEASDRNGGASGALAGRNVGRNGPARADGADATPMPVTVTGHVVDPSHRPVAGVDVELTSIAKGGGDFTATSGADGSYKLAVTSGAWDVHASGKTMFASPERLVIAGSPAVTTHDIVVQLVATVNGHVLNATGSPVAGATVTVDTTTDSVTTDASGAYELFLPAGVAHLRADADQGVGFALAPAVAPGAFLVIDILIEDPAIVTGHVLDDHGAGVADADVSSFSRDNVHDNMQKATTKTDAQGAFRLELPPGMIDVEARHAGAATSGAQRLKLDTPGAHADIVLTVGAAVAFHGIVVDGDGAPVSGAHVKTRLDGEHANLTATDTDSDGHFAFEGAKAGGYIVQVNAGDLAARTHVDIAADSQPVTITLAQPGGIRGTVTFEEADSAQAPDVNVSVEHFMPAYDDKEAPPPIGKQTFAGQSGFTLSNLSAGTYGLLVVARGHAPVHVANVEVKDGAYTDVSVTLPMGAPLTGTVTIDGTPFDGARVAVDGVAVFTDVHGRFTLGAIAPGPVTLTVDDGVHLSVRRDVTVTPQGADVAIEISSPPRGGS